MATAGSDAKPVEPIIVVGCLRSATGLGQSARLSYQALRSENVDVYGIDVSAPLMQPVDIPDFSFRDGRSIYGTGTLLIHVNSPFLPLALLSIGRHLVRDKWIVGYWAWELPRVPQDWRYGIPFVNEIWVPSRFVADALSAVAGDTRIRVLPHPVAAGMDGFPASERHHGRPFTVLTIFDMASSFERKNPLAAIEAFRQAFPGDRTARMIVKVQNTKSFPDGHRRLQAAIDDADNIALIDRTMRFSEIIELYREASCLLSLHRSEGFGLPLAEAALLGLPVVATDWSGSTDFVTAQIAYPIPYRLAPARDPQHTYDWPDMVWAEADVAAAAAALRHIRSNEYVLQAHTRTQLLDRFSAASYAASVRQALQLESCGQPQYGNQTEQNLLA
jgi:glycosyltransferase involved in cell wall biosynthesis